MVNFLERAIRLYEQEPGEEMAPARLGAYVRRWEGWARSGLSGCVWASTGVPNTKGSHADTFVSLGNNDPSQLILKNRPTYIVASPPQSTRQPRGPTPHQPHQP